MIKHFFPFSMGKTIRVDPASLEPYIDHPVLDISSSYSCFKFEVEMWMCEKFPKCQLGWDKEHYIEFETEEQLLEFVLRWL